MKTGVILVFLTVLLSGCSADETDKQSPKPQATQSAPALVETKRAEPAANSPTRQSLQPDLHISGTKSVHISGMPSTSSHISGQ